MAAELYLIQGSAHTLLTAASLCLCAGCRRQAMTSLQQMTLRAFVLTVMLCNRVHPAQLQYYHPSGHILDDQEGRISLGVFTAGHRYQTGQTLQMTC